jgi:hypothetical protein
MPRRFQFSTWIAVRLALAELIAYSVAGAFSWVLPIFDESWFVPATMILFAPFAMMRALNEWQEW